MPPLGTTTAAPATSTTRALDPSEQAAKDAEAVYRRFLTIARRIGTSGGMDITGLDEVATGGALAQYQLSQRDYIDKGVKVRGSRRLVWLRVARTSESNVTIVACIDYRHSYAVGPHGERLKDTNKVSFIRHTARLVPIDGVWKVRKVTAVAEASCAED